MNTEYNYRITQWIENVAYLYDSFIDLGFKYQEYIREWHPFSCYDYNNNPNTPYLGLVGFPQSIYTMLGMVLIDCTDGKKMKEKFRVPKETIPDDVLSQIMKRYISNLVDDNPRAIRNIERLMSGLVCADRKEITERIAYAKKLIPPVTCYPHTLDYFETTSYYIMAHIRNEMATLDNDGRHGYFLQYSLETLADAIAGEDYVYPYASSYAKSLIGRNLWNNIEIAKDVITWELRGIIQDFNLDISRIEESTNSDLTFILEAEERRTGKEKKKKPTLTTAQQALFIKHALGQMGVGISVRNGDGGISQRQLARLIQVILGGDKDAKIENTSIYAALKKITKEPDNDNRKLAQVLIELEFTELANKLNG